MLFKKEKRMIDIRELQKRGVVQIPKNDIVIPTDKDGFVELNKNNKSSSQSTPSNTEFFGFMDSPSASHSSENSFATQIEGYDKREVDEKITNLDNKIYKLENRIELLERKPDVNQTISQDRNASDNQNTSVGVMGW